MSGGEEEKIGKEMPRAGMNRQELLQDAVRTLRMAVLFLQKVLPDGLLSRKQLPVTVYRRQPRMHMRRNL